MKRLFFVLLGLLLAQAAQATLNVVATTASLGMLAREVGGSGVNVSVLAPPDRDVHMLQARPSMMRALRDADLVLAVGAELEAGWLPAAIAGAANPALLPGRPGYFEAAAQVPLLEAGQAADRAQGDVHPMGNPHVNLDPQRMVRIAAALAERLGRLDPPRQAAYRDGAARFARAVEARLPDWKARAAGSPGAVLYHKDGNYLLALLGVPVLGYLEPVPGVPPGAGHLNGLAARLRGSRGVILYPPWQAPRGPDTLAAALGWKTVALPNEPGGQAGVADYLGLIDRWVAALASAR